MPEETIQAVEVEFALKVGEGKLNARIQVPAGQTNLTELLPIIQSFENSIIGGVVQSAADAGFSISCKAGCGA